MGSQSLFFYGLELEEVAMVFKIHNLCREPLKFVNWQKTG